MTEGGRFPEWLSEPAALRANAPLLLEPYGDWWAIEAGVVALFSVELRDGEVWGARDHLFNAAPGDVLFGLGANLGHVNRGVLAVSLGEAALRKGDERDLRRWRAESPCACDAALLAWTRHWTAIFDIPPPGREGDWLERTLPVFQRKTLRALVRHAESERQAQAQRVEDGANSARDSGRLAVQKLRAVLQDSPDLALPTGDDLYRTAHLVGQAAGLELRPLARSSEAERLRDPVEALARAARVGLRRVSLRGDWWRSDCGPLLGRTKGQGRPVALLPAGSGYALVDPRKPERVSVDAKVAASVEAQAWSFYRPFADRALRPWDLVGFALRGRRRDLLGILALGVIGALLSMVMPVATGLIVDYAIPDADEPLIWQLFGALFAASLGFTSISLASGFLFLRVEAHADADTQAAIWSRLLSLRASFFRRFTVGDLKSRVSAVSKIRTLLSGTAIRSAFPSVMALLNLGLMLFLSVPMALVACVAGLVKGGVAVASALLILRYERRLQELRGEIFGGTLQLVQGVGKLRVAAAEERAFLFWASRYSEQQDLVVRSQRIKDLLRVAGAWVGVASTIALFGVAEGLLRDPALALSAGSFLAFYAAYGAFLGGVNGLSGVVPDLARIKVLEERARPILEAEPEVDATKTDPGRLEGRVALEQVTFRYRPGGPAVLSDVSLSAEAGEMIALVGPSGAGKSTVARLLLGFESPESGRVRVDGQDLASLDVAAVRRQFGVVLEDGRLNAGTIFETVSGVRRVSPAEVQEALRAAGLADEVAEMPMGLHTVISEGGANLSGGQRQRLLVARALAQRPAVMLLDEATSALDNRTQAKVAASLDALDVTRVVIAHRLSTVRNADRIYVLDEGEVVQEGSFDALMAEDGLFRRLMQRQT